MDLLRLMLITIHISTTLQRRHVLSSDESIENLLYYKDCRAKATDAPLPMPEPLRATEPTPRGMGCQFPKMCCSMSCDNECGGLSNRVSKPSKPWMLDNDFEGMDDMMKLQVPQTSRQMPLKRKKPKPSHDPLPPIGGRREFGFTKEKIKSLISKDSDIRKILKDLVRVTMKKVDLVQMINAKKPQPNVDLRVADVSQSDELE